MGAIKNVSVRARKGEPTFMSSSVPSCSSQHGALAGSNAAGAQLHDRAARPQFRALVTDVLIIASIFGVAFAALLLLSYSYEAVLLFLSVLLV